MSDNTNLLKLSNSSVRDLVWVMDCPSLLSDTQPVVSDAYCQSMVIQHASWWQQLDDQPELLTQWLARENNSRLGHYFEQLVAFWLQHKIAQGYCDSHVRVFQAKRVLGEFDFLFDTRGDTLHHWETAVKFYIRYQQKSGEYRWYGPNASDRLDIKLARMKDHQLRLGETAEGRELLSTVLQSRGLNGLQPQAFFKGYLFYPSESDWQHPDSIPHYVSDNHLRGWWTRIDRLVVAEMGSRTSPENRWIVLPRLNWLAPQLVTGAMNNNLLLSPQLQVRLARHFDRSRRAVLVAEMERESESRWRECSRGFIVSESWPEFESTAGGFVK